MVDKDPNDVLDFKHWSQDDIDEFMEEYDVEESENDDSDNDPMEVHPGAVMVGIVLFFSFIYSLYIQNFQFSYVNLVLLVALALGSKAIN